MTWYPGAISVFFEKEYTKLRKSGIGVRPQRAESSNKKYLLNCLQKRMNADKTELKDSAKKEKNRSLQWGLERESGRRTHGWVQLGKREIKDLLMAKSLRKFILRKE